jgi:hypothetical protein
MSRQMKKILGLTAVLTAIVSPFFWINNSIASDLKGLREVRLSQLKDGHHQVCMDTDTEGLVCLRFQKRAQEIVGFYSYPATESSVCIEGRIDNKSNTIRGITVEGPNPGENKEPSATEITAIQKNGYKYKDWLDLPENKLRIGRAKYMGNFEVQYQAKLSLINRLYYVPGITAKNIAQPFPEGWYYHKDFQGIPSSCIKS